MGMIAVSDEILRQVSTLAERNHVSLQRQAEELLRQALATTPQPESLAQVWTRIADMSPSRPVGDSLKLLREDRDQ